MKIREILNKIQTELHAPKGQVNNFGKYKYRSCEDILEALKPLLKETGATVGVSDEVLVIGDRYYVRATATLLPPDGEGIRAVAYAREPESKKGMDEAQLTGATSSYARKYALNGLFCIDDTKDADTMDNSQKAPQKATVSKPAVDEKVKAEILAISKEKFKTPMMTQSWRKNKGFPVKLSDCTNEQLNSMLELLTGE